LKVLVVTVSDRASKGDYEDRSGPAVEQVLREMIPGVEIKRMVVPDERSEIMRVLSDGLWADCILTTGGTGLSPRDITPEATMEFCDRLIPGIAEYLRAESLAQTSSAILSRGVAGQKGSTVVINMPGSVKGAEFCTRRIAPMLAHAVAMMAGGDHGAAPKPPGNGAA
jgi:molybdopterin adenylyltransferase